MAVALPDDKITAAIVGALAAQMLALLAQVFVIPALQRRSRRREKWEDSVADLSSAVGDELPPAVRRLRRTGDELRFWTLLQANEDQARDLNEQALTDQIEKAKTQHQEAAEAATELLRRIKRLVASVQRLRRKAPYWRTLRIRLHWLEVAIVTNSISWQTAEYLLEDEAWKNQGIRLDKDAEELVKLADDLWNRLAPPPFGLRLRTKEIATAKTRSIKAVFNSASRRIRRFARKKVSAIEPARVGEG